MWPLTSLLLQKSEWGNALNWPVQLLSHWKKKWSHFELKSWVTGRTKIRPWIPTNWRIFESIWLSISSRFYWNILQLFRIPGWILVPQVTQLFRSTWLNFFFQCRCEALKTSYRTQWEQIVYKFFFLLSHFKSKDNSIGGRPNYTLCSTKKRFWKCITKCSFTDNISCFKLHEKLAIDKTCQTWNYDMMFSSHNAMYACIFLIRLWKCLIHTSMLIKLSYNCEGLLLCWHL